MTLKNYFIFDQFKILSFRVIPINSFSAILHFFNNLACILPILTNYICFYYIIKDSYKKKTPLQENLVSQDDFVFVNECRDKNKDLEDYLDKE